MANAKEQPQAHMEDTVIDDPDLQGLLYLFMESKKASSEAARAHKANKDRVAAQVDGHGWVPGGVYRVGPYVIKITESEAKSVEFERGASRRISVVGPKEA